MILAIIAALQTTPASPTLPEVHTAIWDDLATNAWLYTGNAIAAGSWYFGHDRDHPPTMRISDVRCIRVFSERSCRFRLIRTPIQNPPGLPMTRPNIAGSPVAPRCVGKGVRTARANGGSGVFRRRKARLTAGRPCDAAPSGRASR